MTRDPLHEAGLVVDQRRWSAPRPRVAMHHHEIIGCRVVEVRSVSANNGFPDGPLNFYDFRTFPGFGRIGFRLYLESGQSRHVGPSLAWQNLGGIDACGRHRRTMDSPVREKLPATVAFRIDTFKPDRGQVGRRVRGPVLWHEQADV